jgi:hypothetical protein
LLSFGSSLATIAAPRFQVSRQRGDAVPGGTAELTRAIEIEPIPDRARFVTELVRLIYSISKENRETADSTFRRLIAHFQAVGRNNADVRGSTPELVPIPLTAAVWSQAVFHRPVAPADLFTTVMSDHSAALLAYGLAALDDETLHFLIDQPAVISRLYEHDATVFAAFAERLHIHNNRVVVPGGDEAALGRRHQRETDAARALRA